MNTPTETKTPRTDKEAELGIGPRAITSGNAVSASFARQLEQELQQAQKFSKTQAEWLCETGHAKQKETERADKAIAELQQAREELDFKEYQLDIRDTDIVQREMLIDNLQSQLSQWQECAMEMNSAINYLSSALHSGKPIDKIGAIGATAEATALFTQLTQTKEKE